MKWYAVAELQITDPGWVSSYVENVTRQVEARGGRFLARTSKVEVVEGAKELPQVFMIVQWPSRQSAQEFYDSAEYQPYLQARLNGSKGRFIVVAGEDMTRAANVPQ